MRARSLELRLAKMLDYPEGQIDQRLRELRTFGLIPTGGRGVHAPQIDATHAAAMLLMMVSLRATDAFSIGFCAMNLEFVPVPGVGDAFYGYSDQSRLTLGGALAYLLSAPSAPWSKLEVDCDGLRAWLQIEMNGEPLELLFVADKAAVADRIRGDFSVYRNQGAAYIGHRFVLGAGQAAQISYHLTHEVEAGWAGDTPDALAMARERMEIAKVREELSAAGPPAPAHTVESFNRLLTSHGDGLPERQEA